MMNVGVYSDRIEYWIGIISILFQGGKEDEDAHFYDLTPVFFLTYENLKSDEEDMDFIILDKKVFPEGIVEEILDTIGFADLTPTTDMNLMLFEELRDYGYNVIIGENFCI